MNTTTITVSLGTRQATFLSVLGPRPWDPGTFRVEPSPIGTRPGSTRVRVTMDARTAAAAVEQLRARGDHKTAARIVAALLVATEPRTCLHCGQEPHAPRLDALGYVVPCTRPE